MSKNNVNPDHYKVAGRERQGEDVVHSVERQAMKQQEAEQDRWQAKKKEKKAPAARSAQRKRST